MARSWSGGGGANWGSYGNINWDSHKMRDDLGLNNTLKTVDDFYKLPEKVKFECNWIIVQEGTKRGGDLGTIYVRISLPDYLSAKDRTWLQDKVSNFIKQHALPSPRVSLAMRYEPKPRWTVVGFA